MQRHIAECEELRRTRRDSTALASPLSQSAGIEPSADFSERLNAGLRELKDAESRSGISSFSMTLRRR